MAMSPGGNRAEPDEAYEKRLEELERAKQQSWEEKEKLSKQLEKERAENMVCLRLEFRESVVF